MTPAEMKLCIEAEEEKFKQQLYIAYMAAYWQRVNKLEPFENYFKKSSMTDEEMLKEIKIINQALGGE